MSSIIQTVWRVRFWSLSIPHADFNLISTLSPKASCTFLPQYYVMSCFLPVSQSSLTDRYSIVLSSSKTNQQFIICITPPPRNILIVRRASATCIALAMRHCKSTTRTTILTSRRCVCTFLSFFPSSSWQHSPQVIHNSQLPTFGKIAPRHDTTTYWSNPS